MLKKTCYRCTQNCFKKAIQKIAEATANLTGNKIADKITEDSRPSRQNISETVTNEKKMWDLIKNTKRKITPEKRQKGY